jgi:hypothetical protein
MLGGLVSLEDWACISQETADQVDAALERLKTIHVTVLSFSGLADGEIFLHSQQEPEVFKKFIDAAESIILVAGEAKLGYTAFGKGQDGELTLPRLCEKGKDIWLITAVHDAAPERVSFVEKFGQELVKQSSNRLKFRLLNPREPSDKHTKAHNK